MAVVRYSTGQSKCKEREKTSRVRTLQEMARETCRRAGERRRRDKRQRSASHDETPDLDGWRRGQTGRVRAHPHAHFLSVVPVPLPAFDLESLAVMLLSAGTAEGNAAPPVRSEEQTYV
jgi:hypothetical protein